jgi:hypothetical protein
MGKRPLPKLRIGMKKQKNPTGKIIDILGDEGDNDAEMLPLNGI